MITIHNLDVGQADCILVCCEKNNKYFNILVDGAYKRNHIETRLNNIIGDRDIQSIVVTHVDRDHIMGILDLVKNGYEKINNAFVIFNKFAPELVSYKDGKELEIQLEKHFPNNKIIKSYQEEFSQEEIKQLNTQEECLEIKLRSLAQRKQTEKLEKDIVYITILGPSEPEVSRFMQNWNNNTNNAELVNRTSISLLIEFDGKAIVLPGDGYYTDVYDAIENIEVIEKIHAVKAAHHGAKANNIKLLDFVKKYKVENVFFTVEDSKYDNKKEHPDTDIIEALKKLKDEINADKSSGYKLEITYNGSENDQKTSIDLQKNMTRKNEIIL